MKVALAVALGALLGLAAVAAVIAQEPAPLDATPPTVADPSHEMSDDDRCRHMPEHCGASP